MADVQRIKKVINWLIFMEFAENERDMAEKLGYTKSSFSQIMNGKVPISDKFIKKLCSVDENINEVWITSGEGEMLKTAVGSADVVTVPANVWDVIKAQADSLKNRDRQIDELLSLLKSQMEESKKIPAQQGDDATSAVAG
jgi:transcriptional regulator with XRE-family HTH domain